MPISLSGSLLITGSLTASGTLTAQTLVVQTVTSSIVYSSGSNIFGNSQSNVQQMTGSLRVTGSGNHYIQGGNVGIGTTSPSAWNGNQGLLVSQTGTGNTNTIYSLQSAATSVDTGGILEGFSTNTTAGSKALGSIVFLRENTSTTALSSYTGFYTNNAGTVAERMRITSAGNVLVGTTSVINPAAKLEVKGDVFITPIGSVASKLHLYNNDSTNETYIYDSGSSSTSILAFAPGGVTKMVVISSGNVGIDTTTPLQPLQLGQVSVISQDANSMYIGANFGSSTGGNYIKSQYANQIHFDSAIGTMNFKVAGSGTAGNAISYNTAMAITSAGILCIGTTGQLINEASLAVTSNGNTATFKTTTNSGNSTILSWNNVTSGNNSFMEFGTETTFTVRGSITYNRGSAVVAYNTTSDYRLKSEINDFNALEIVSNLKPKEFRIGDAINKSFGFIAHELQEYLPQAVTGEKDEMKEDGTPKYQGVDYSQLTGLLTKAIQELKAENDTLKERLTALENR
jgi:hypothetical protein